VKETCKRYGYEPRQVRMRLFVGRFAGGHEDSIRKHLGKFKDPSVEVIGLKQIVDELTAQAESRSYIDDPVLVTMKALIAANRLNPATDSPSSGGSD
jgi:hypothetical protein